MGLAVVSGDSREGEGRHRKSWTGRGRGSIDVNTVFMSETLKNLKSIILGMATIQN